VIIARTRTHGRNQVNDTKEINHMSKRMVALRKTMILLGLGGAFAFPFWGGDLGLGDYGCIRNSDLVTFYQDVGGAGIAEFTDTTRDLMPYPEDGDFDTIVILPTQTFWTGLLDNWVAQQFPLDLDTTGPVVQ
jgi:hypothetical protein